MRITQLVYVKTQTIQNQVIFSCLKIKPCDNYRDNSDRGHFYSFLLKNNVLAINLYRKPSQNLLSSIIG